MLHEESCLGCETAEFLPANTLPYHYDWRPHSGRLRVREFAQFVCRFRFRFWHKFICGFQSLCHWLTVSLAPGSSGSVVFTMAAISGFNQPVNVSLIGLPSSIAASPSSFSLLPGAQQVVVFTLSSATAIGNTSINTQATAGAISHTITVTLIVATQLPPATTAHAPICTRYLRTNSAYDRTRWNTPHPTSLRTTQLIASFS